MNTKKILESTRNTVNSTLDFSQSVIEQSKKLRTPSPKVMKIGTAAGVLIGTALVLTGTVQLGISKSLWGVGSLTAGSATILSNSIYYLYRRKK